MKQMILNYKGRQYQSIVCHNGNRLCDISVYRKRINKKWYQFKWEDFTSFLCSPDTMDDLRKIILATIIKKVQEEEAEAAFQSEYKKLEDVSFL